MIGGYLGDSALLNTLSIVILSFNTLDLLKRCIATLLDYQIESAHLIVVDNASTDGSKEWLRAQGDGGIRTVLLDENRGFAAGNNVGLKLVETELVLLLNSDAFPAEGSLEKMLTALQRSPLNGVVGAQLVYGDGSWQRCSGPIHSPTQAMFEAFGFPGIHRAFTRISWRYFGGHWRSHEVGYVAGAAMLIRKSILDQVGLLDERFFFYTEDVEFCARVADAHYRVILEPQARVIHLHGSSSSKKDYRASFAMMRSSRQTFIESRYGAEGWKRYARWVGRGYAWRGALSRIGAMVKPELRNKCEQYRAAAAAYRV